MDTAHAYVHSSGTSIALYAPPTLDVPDTLTLRSQGAPVEFIRASDRELTCDPVGGVTGKCGAYECHRRVIGSCQCGRHPEGVRIRPAAGRTT